MIDTPFAFAFAAGLVATVNPCGFAMLPAYLAYFLGVDEGDGTRGGGLGRALGTGAAVSAGFLVVFGAVGALVTAGLRSVVDYVPWAALVIGVALTLFGLAMLLFGYEPTFGLPKLGRGASSRRATSMFAFGVSYAVASLSCGLPIFLTVAGAATASTNFVSGFLTFVTYGAGMSMLLIVITLALALARGGLVRWLRSATRYVSRVSGAILVVAGVYITVYWAANLGDPFAARGAAFRLVERPQRWLTDQLGTRPDFWALVFGALIASAVLLAAWSRRASSGRAEAPTGTSARPRTPEQGAAREDAVVGGVPDRR